MRRDRLAPTPTAARELPGFARRRWVPGGSFGSRQCISILLQNAPQTDAQKTEKKEELLAVAADPELGD